MACSVTLCCSSCLMILFEFSHIVIVFSLMASSDDGTATISWCMTNHTGWRSPLLEKLQEDTIYPRCFTYVYG